MITKSFEIAYTLFIIHKFGDAFNPKYNPKNNKVDNFKKALIGYYGEVVDSVLLLRLYDFMEFTYNNKLLQEAQKLIDFIVARNES